MTRAPETDDDRPLTPEQERLVARMRRLSLVSALIMVLGFAAVFGVIGYRLFGGERSAASFADVTATLPSGAVIRTSEISDGLVVVTLDVGGSVEVRTFDLATMRPVGRLRFASEP